MSFLKLFDLQDIFLAIHALYLYGFVFSIAIYQHNSLIIQQQRSNIVVMMLVSSHSSYSAADINICIYIIELHCSRPWLQRVAQTPYPIITYSLNQITLTHLTLANSLSRLCTLLPVVLKNINHLTRQNTLPSFNKIGQLQRRKQPLQKPKMHRLILTRIITSHHILIVCSLPA